MKKQPSSGGPAARTDNRVEQRNQKQNQAAQLSAANVEESPHMDRRDSAAGSGQSLGEAPGVDESGASSERGAVDTQYGTRSASKTGQAGRASSGGSGSGSGQTGTPHAPNPGSSEESSGTDRDTMTGPRPGSGA
jgi:hypothetical protein